MHDGDVSTHGYSPVEALPLHLRALCAPIGVVEVATLASWQLVSARAMRPHRGEVNTRVPPAA